MEAARQKTSGIERRKTKCEMDEPYESYDSQCRLMCISQTASFLINERGQKPEQSDISTSAGRRREAFRRPGSVDQGRGTWRKRSATSQTRSTDCEEHVIRSLTRYMHMIYSMGSSSRVAQAAQAWAMSHWVVMVHHLLCSERVGGGD